MYRRAAAIAFFVLFQLWGSTASGEETEARPTILAVRLYISDGMLTSDVKSTGLFSDQIVGTVQSGLPAIVELYYSLDARNNGSVKKGIFSYELCYDVWDDRYSIEATDTTAFYPTFDALRQAVQHIRNLALAPVHEIATNKEYSVRLGVTVNPLSGSDRQKITGWLGETVRGKSTESWREQVLNLNDLIKHFFARRKTGTNQSEWFQTDFFSPEKLPVREEKVE
ncbi:MAG: DUF4390 domain-containing protein [Candidatus Latescibacteria bacterium]|nr:DUF4390 domain-containing protein [Candidatus Latescibacterota bacterium]NIM64413.1 DUF4390 domain-containing protein [Candidatus Latescibacterota bacterium]NIO00567.1 DUF4390 domain-containing protein [Candidatus Latescibacterota bacterium]NIO26967.1 DUF4390 domain-containing protein [Candidatus Latescibacterota bacterium]NIO56044.1 DUF4390 domain-containing protein [Candidatus Latescibacterota bacterium]